MFSQLMPGDTIKCKTVREAIHLLYVLTAEGIKATSIGKVVTINAIGTPPEVEEDETEGKYEWIVIAKRVL